jgi:hypothetical protein
MQQPNRHAVPWAPNQQQPSPVPTTTVLVPTQAQDGSIVYMPMLLPIASLPPPTTAAGTATNGTPQRLSHGQPRQQQQPPSYWNPMQQAPHSGHRQSPAVFDNASANTGKASAPTPTASSTPTSTTRRVKASKQHLVKSKLCRHFMRAVGCRNGTACPFAHGEHELNQPQPQQQQQHQLSGPPSQETSSPSQASSQDGPLLPLLPSADCAGAPAAKEPTVFRSDAAADSRPVTAEPIAFMSPASHHGAIAPTPLSQADDESGYNGGLTVLQLPSLDDFAAMTFAAPNDSAMTGTLPDAVAASILTGVEQF